MPAPPRYVVVANPGSGRWEAYRTELRRFWAERSAEPDLELVPWADVVAADGDVTAHPAFARPAVVRLESPGRSDDVTRLLLAAGARDDPAEPPRDWPAVDLPKGILLRPGLRHRGFVRVLRGLRASFDRLPHMAPTACPLAVAAMFDKTATAARLAAAGVPTPPVFPPDRHPAEAVELDWAVRDLGWPGVYLKLNTGSSATGIIAVRYRRPSDGEAITTLARADGGYFNTRRPRRLGYHDLVHAVGFLMREGLMVQRGVPLARADGLNFDVRVVCVYAKPAAAVFRLSPHPMTNLHLGGRRGDPAHMRSLIPPRQWLDGLDAAAAAAELFASAVAGVDVAFERGTFRPFVLEVNAFGDFFPGHPGFDGHPVHRAEIAATAGRDKI